jgi:SAM-dependent methyltransferase
MQEGPYQGLATTFDTAAELYEHARPRYPPQLFDDLAALTGLETRQARVLEIGPGTGQATRALLARGWRVVALEPGPQLAKVAQRVLAGLGDVEVVTAPFERWPGGDGAFDLVFAATSFHWLDPTVAFRRTAELLRPGGSLAIVSTAHVLPEADGDLFFRDVEEAYAAVAMSDGKGGPAPPEQVSAPDATAIRTSGFFEWPVVRRYLSQQSYSAQEYLDLLSTYSNHIAATAEQREQLFVDIRRRIQARPRARVRKHYLNILQTARRVG